MDDPRATVEEVEAEAAERRERTERGAAIDPADLTIAFTPKQILGGFALLAALVMLLRRNRDRDRAGRD